MKRFLLFILLFVFSSISYSQHNEYYFKFTIAGHSELNKLTRIISIDNVIGNEVYAYANDEEMKDFLKFGYLYQILPHPGTLINARMTDDPDKVLEWDYYPTYGAYIAMMNGFASQYPGLCRIVNAGPTVQNRAILFAVISDNVNVREPEPRFQYSSSMHGDETTGYVLMLRLINYLLTNYGTDPKVTSLVNNVEIWINPLANPDGTFRSGDSIINGAWRYNANGKDLNRNFPDPAEGPYPTGAWQPETIAMMNLAGANHFSMSVNFHGGAEVVNYPWDTWARLTADNSWWVYVCRQYADTVHANSPPPYMRGFNSGITNGYAWYRVVGGRQDYMTYFQHGRECTIELSNTKLLPPAQLPAHWNYNYKSFLNYIKQVLYGITGTVTDSVTGLPVKAKVSIIGHDLDSSEVYSDSLFGKYYRVIYTGTYNVTYTAPGYYAKTVNGVYVKNDSTTVRNVQLRPIGVGIVSNENGIPKEFKLHQNYPNPFNPTTRIKFDLPVGAIHESPARLIIFDILGREVATLVNERLKPGSYEVEWNASNYPSGVYFYRLSTAVYKEIRRMVLLK